MERTMSKLRVTVINSYCIEKQQTNIPEQLIQKLYQFLSSYYHVPNQKEFHSLILRLEEHGELIIYLGINQEIAGFSRLFRQQIKVGKKQVITYSALIYLNPLYHVCPTVSSTGLTEAIKYKLAHPHEELIYVGFADNPLTYEFLYNLSDSIYPKPLQRVPDQIITVIDALKNRIDLYQPATIQWLSIHRCCQLKIKFCTCMMEMNSMSSMYQPIQTIYRAILY